MKAKNKRRYQKPKAVKWTEINSAQLTCTGGRTAKAAYPTCTSLRS